MPRLTVQLPGWGAWLPSARGSGYRYIVHYGGRAGGKSTTYAMALSLLGVLEPLRILCVREFQNSLSESSKSTIEGAIEAQGLSDYYDVQKLMIRGLNGTEFLFRGLSNITAARIKSFEGADLVWIEEGQDLSESSWGLLEPTIRKPGSQIWISFNPQRSTDIVYRLFVSNLEQPGGSFVKKVNYTDNPFVSAETLSSVEYSRRLEPEIYRHRWLGEVMPDLGVLRVLPMADLDRCVSAFGKYAAHGEGLRPDVGLDVADLGPDLNALAIRRGPVLEDVQVWRGTRSLGDTTRRADRVAGMLGAVNFFYDGSGVGSNVRSFLHEMGRRPYRIRATHFGSSPEGPDVKFDGQFTNRAMFAMRNAQMAWGLRLRAQNTTRLLSGEDVDPLRCLFVNPDIVGRLETAGLLEQLNQPTWDDGEGNRIRIRKAADGERSPDMFDAACLAFARDSLHGLRASLSL